MYLEKNITFFVAQSSYVEGLVDVFFNIFFYGRKISGKYIKLNAIKTGLICKCSLPNNEHFHILQLFM